LNVDSLKIYIELYPKQAARDLGFPDLLIDISVNTSPDLSSYSYAKYQNGELYKRVGDYFYNFNLAHYKHSESPFVLINQNNYSHLLFNINNDRSLIISTKNKSILVVLAPFSYLFLFFIVFFALFYALFIFPHSHRKITFNFSNRLQTSIISVILFSFIVVGIFTLYYINNLNDEKNQDILSEKTHSVLVEMQHKFSTEEYFDESLQEKLSEMLVKFSNVFFTDINMYQPNGVLISSSRQQIYDEDLVSDHINPMAYKAMVVDNNSLFIHNENIGKQCYLSAYIPFVNSMGQVIGYLNLPYFAQEKDLNKEISTFLVAYINIYVILIALSILITIIISKYISRPINLVISKIRQVKLGGKNETITWKREDEIGQLVQEYNRMIEEMARSAELLAKSERESAWREMAKQIAHEIKNPLTPMKLSVQYLQRAWKNQLPDYEKRLEKFTQTMIEQIDALSIIASEFSDFAKMPVNKRTYTNLTEIIDSTLVLFKNYDNITFSFLYDNKSDSTVYADKEQLLRAFNNLITNSIQAIGKKANGKIEINLERQHAKLVVEIADNGEGISEEISDKIFSPNFTTKSGGMGLGLAIVKNIVVNAGGSIEYHSRAGEGTTFIVVFPASQNMD
jgi:signal transduction histidine kinase